ncbi:MAG TPA: hypothetical protein VFI25_06010 [Planctomycetota bacterium]|jgi:hypothetical protein|nr:hypothetical protein [Planctomycetota bacterium]
MTLDPPNDWTPEAKENERPRRRTRFTGSAASADRLVDRVIAARPPVGRWLAGLFTPEAAIGDDMVRFLVLHDPAVDRILRVEPFAGEAAVEEAARSLLSAVAGGGPTAPLPGRPTEIWTDSTALEESAREALAGLGIQLVWRESLPELERLRERLAGFLERRRPGAGRRRAGTRPMPNAADRRAP